MSWTIKDNTDEVLSALEKAKKRGLDAIGLAAEGHAKKITPVDTGRLQLRNSISHDTDDEAAYIGTNVSYGPFVQLNWAQEAGKGNTCSNEPQVNTPTNTSKSWKMH